MGVGARFTSDTEESSARSRKCDDAQKSKSLGHVPVLWCYMRTCRVQDQRSRYHVSATDGQRITSAKSEADIITQKAAREQGGYHAITAARRIRRYTKLRPIIRDLTRYRLANALGVGPSSTRAARRRARVDLKEAVRTAVINKRRRQWV